MDKILHVEIENGQARALIATTTHLVKKAQEIHSLSHLASAALGRALSGAAILGTMQKNERDRLTITFRGDGPLSPIVCVAGQNAAVKGYLENPDLELPLKENGKLDVGRGVGSNGRLIVVRDLGMREPYVGQTNLVSGEIAEDIATYLTVSEQTASLMALGVRLEQGIVVSAGGVLIQPLPGCPEETLQRLEALAPTLSNISNIIKDAGDADSLLQMLLGDFQTRVLESSAPKWLCECSRQRIEQVLLSMGQEEILDMIDKQGGAEVSCHFCNKQYTFTKEDLETLLEEGLS